MASVRMTNEIRSNITRRATQAFDVARPTPKLNNEHTTLLRDAITRSRPYQILKELFDNQDQHSDFKSFEGFPKPVKRQAVSVLSVNLDQHSIYVEFVPQMLIYTQSSWGSTHLAFNELTAADQYALRPAVEQLIADLAAHEKDKNDYYHKIHSLVNECTTVKQMLLAWPAGEAFVPPECMTRMYEKVTRIERAKAIKQEVSFDDSFVNEVVLTAKLVGG